MVENKKTAVKAPESKVMTKETDEKTEAVKTIAVAKPVVTKTEAVKPAEKKPVAKKPVAKKPVAKKTATKEVAKTTSAKKVEANQIVNFQFDGKSYTIEDLVKIAKDVWKYDHNMTVADFKTVELYVKPEESLAYYVINGDVTGSFHI